MSAASDLSTALNARDYSAAAQAMSALSSSSQVQSGSVELQDLSADALTGVTDGGTL